MSLRQAIRNKLIDDLSIGVYETEIVTSDTQKPYIVIKNANQIESNIKQGFENYYNIYVYSNIGDKTTLDTLKDNVINSLNNQKLTLGNIANTLKYRGFVSSEFVDDVWNASGQGLIFTNDTIIE